MAVSCIHLYAILLKSIKVSSESNIIALIIFLVDRPRFELGAHPCEGCDLPG